MLLNGRGAGPYFLTQVDHVGLRKYLKSQHNTTQPNDSYTLLTMSIFLKPN